MCPNPHCTGLNSARVYMPTNSVFVILVTTNKSNLIIYFRQRNLYNVKRVPSWDYLSNLFPQYKLRLSSGLDGCDMSLDINLMHISLSIAWRSDFGDTVRAERRAQRGHVAVPQPSAARPRVLLRGAHAPPGRPQARHKPLRQHGLFEVPATFVSTREEFAVGGNFLRTLCLPGGTLLDTRPLPTFRRLAFGTTPTTGRRL